MKHIKSTIPFIIFTLLSILLYYKVLHAPFLLDDIWYIENNSKIKNLSTFITDISGTRYIGFLTFALNYYFNGLNTHGYHIVNILIHLLNTFLVYYLVEITLDRLKDIDSRLKTQDTRLKFEVWSLESGVLGLYYLPFACSLIFLVHPIQTQAVSYITQRFTSLAALFYLLTLILYIKVRLKTQDSRHETQTKILNLKSSVYSLESWVLYLGSLVSTILAMKTKEISWTLPFIILLYEFTFLNNNPLNPPLLRGNNRQQTHASSPMPYALCHQPSAPQRLLYLIPFFLTLIIIPLSLFGSDLPIEGSGADEGLLKFQLRDIREFSAYNYLLTQFRVIITYIRLLFIPINQHFEYDFPLSKSIFEPATLISFIVLLSIVIFAVYLFIRSRKTHHAHGLLVSFGILWFFITLSIESSIIPIKDVISEHRLYLPSVGFILSMTTAIFYGLKTQDSRPKAKVFSLVSIVLSLFFIITGIFSFASYKRNVLWRDSLLFYLDEVKKSPNRPAPHNNLGMIYYYEKGLVDKALEHYKITLELDPYYPDAHNIIGMIYYDKGFIDKAIEHYQTALRLKPDYPETHNNIGTAYIHKGWLDKALEHFQIALRLEPDFPDAHYNIGNIYYDRGLIDKAMEHYNIAIKLKPNFPESHNNIGMIYYEKGFIDKAIEHFEIALKLRSNYSEAQDNLRKILKERNIPY